MNICNIGQKIREPPKGSLFLSTENNEFDGKEWI